MIVDIQIYYNQISEKKQPAKVSLCSVVLVMYTLALLYCIPFLISVLLMSTSSA